MNNSELCQNAQKSIDYHTMDLNNYVHLLERNYNLH
jgi:hypothetical protein